MPLSDKNIVITPNVGQSADPTIVFTGANTANAYMINVRVYPTSSGTLSFEGGAGQLFSISNTLTGTIFSVNDISGIPSIEVIDSGVIRLAQYNGNVTIGASNTINASSNLIGALMVNGGIAATGNIYSGALYITGPTSNGITFSDFSTLVTSNNITAAFIQANNAASFANGAFAKANAAYDFANTISASSAQGAFDRANSAYGQANSAASFANGAFLTANSAASFANSAFTKANNALANTTGTFAGDLTVTGNVATVANVNANFFVTTGSAGVITGANLIYSNTFIASVAYQFPDGSRQTTAASNMANNAVITLTSNSQTQITTNNTQGNIVFGLAATGVTAGSYAYYTNWQVDAFGRLTSTTASTILEPMGNSAYAFTNTSIYSITANTNGGLFANGTQGVTQTGNVLISVSNTHITNAVTANTTMGLQVASLGIGAAPTTGYNLRMVKQFTGATTAYGVTSEGTVQSDVTSAAYAFISQLNTQAAAFTLPSYTHYFVGQSTIGAGSTVTSAQGFNVSGSFTGATTNYGLNIGDMSSTTGKTSYGIASSISTNTGTNYNIFANGSAPNYLAGNLGVGTTSTTGKLSVSLADATALSAGGMPAWDSTFAIFGGTGTAGKAVGIGFNGTSNYGEIRSVWPGTSWSDLYIRGNNLNFYTSQAGLSTLALTLSTSGAIGVGSSPSYGTSGQVLTSNGNAPPTWTNVSGGDGLANTGTSITANGLSVYTFANTTPATANNTGAVVVRGGVSVTGNVSVGSSVLMIKSTTNLPGARMVYNATADSIDFIFT